MELEVGSKVLVGDIAIRPLQTTISEDKLDFKVGLVQFDMKFARTDRHNYMVRILPKYTQPHLISLARGIVCFVDEIPEHWTHLEITRAAKKTLFAKAFTDEEKMAEEIVRRKEKVPHTVRINRWKEFEKHYMQVKEDFSFFLDSEGVNGFVDKFELRYKKLLNGEMTFCNGVKEFEELFNDTPVFTYTLGGEALNQMMAIHTSYSTMLTHLKYLSKYLDSTQFIDFERERDDDSNS